MDEQQPLTRDAIRYVDDRPPQLELTAKDRPNDLTATKDWTAAQLRACLSAAQEVVHSFTPSLACDLRD